MSWFFIVFALAMAGSGLALVCVIAGYIIIGILRRVWRLGVWLWIKSVDLRVSRAI